MTFHQLIDQVLVLLAAGVLLGVPGAALVSLLRVRAVLPDTLAVPAGALLGSLVASAATAVQLSTESGVQVAVGVHVALSAALVVAAVVVRRRRAGRSDAVVPVARGWSLATTVTTVVAGIGAWVIRGAVRLDGLYHIALTRKLVELDHPNFDNVNRFADGGPNPAYALPGWHALVGWCGWITNVDPVVAWEIMPVLVVVLGTLAAGGLARVLLATPRAEPVGAFAWLLARVLFARREVDGDAIRYGAVPGQVTFELALPVVLAGVAIALTSDDRRVRRGALGVTFAGIVATVIYHANYLPYVAIIGLGYAVWWFVAARRRGARLHDAKRLLAVGGWVAAMSAGCMAVVLPLLARLENFGNAPDDDRIDYHLTSTFGMQHVRGGHAYEMLGLPGLVAILALPWIAWRWRDRRAPSAIAWGGALALMAFGFLPPLFQLLRASGSLTLLLRINHPIGELLVVAFAALVLELADIATGRGWSHRRMQVWGAAAVVVMWGAGIAMGYDRFSPDVFGYLAFVLLAAVLVASALGRVTVLGVPRQAPPGRVAAVALVLGLGLALPVGAISIKRGIVNADEPAGIAQGDLICLGGDVADALQTQVPNGSVVLSDPVSSFRVMALAPVYVVGDYKVWNAATSDNRAEERLADVNRFFDSSVSDERRLQVLADQGVDYLLVDLQDSRWLDPKWADESTTKLLDRAWRGLDSFADVQTYDGGGAARLVQRNAESFDLLASDDRGEIAAKPEPTPDVEQPCQSYALWKVGDVRSGPVARPIDQTEPVDVVVR
ncbi:MAG: hypothetical protein KDC46_02970 [Thermoleophilia bacterium]|nr:hypothetical protein [Thermoleophilia bacterium]